jgi:phage gp46-like protein
MPDIATRWNTKRGDWWLDGDELAAGHELVTAVLISLFTDRVATPDDVVPDASRKSRDPRGWWGDTAPYPIGSRLWLLERAKRTPGTLALAQGYIAEALKWMVDDHAASKIDVGVEWTRGNTLGAQITVYSPRTGAPLAKVVTQNVFRLPDSQAWGWSVEHGVGQWVELQTRHDRTLTFDLDLDGITNSGESPSLGKTITGLDPWVAYTMTLPLGRLYTAWSFNRNEFNSWVTAFDVMNAEGVTVEYGNGIGVTSAALAFAAYPGAQVSGSSAYTFWLRDIQPTDNAGGLSLRISNAS